MAFPLLQGCEVSSGVLKRQLCGRERGEEEKRRRGRGEETEAEQEGGPAGGGETSCPVGSAQMPWLRAH